MGAGGILAIILALVVFKKDRFDEYSCMYPDGSGPDYLTVAKDHIIDEKRKMLIKKETGDKIVAEMYPGKSYTSIHTFYKRTQKFKSDYGKDTYISTCTKLN